MSNLWYQNVPLVDSHVHFSDIESANKMLEIMKALGIKKMNLASLIDPARINFNPEEIYMKALHPNLFFAFGGLDYSTFFLGSSHVKPKLMEQADTLINIGFDGIKMVEGKPTLRKLLKTPFVKGFYKEYFQYIESLRFPLLFHVNDPEEFWDPEKTPPFAKNRGWYYDETYPKKEELYVEIEEILELYPNLNIIFAHFYFLSGDIERATRLLEKYRGVYFDITPGSEMYYNFSARRDDWRDFFMQFQERILFGTDINDCMSLKSAVSHVERMRSFLETDDPLSWGTYPKKKEPINGLSLPTHVLDKIYYQNFTRIVGKEPSQLNVAAAIRECRRMAKIIKKIGRTESSKFNLGWEAAEKQSAIEQIINMLKNLMKCE